MVYPGRDQLFDSDGLLMVRTSRWQEAAGEDVIDLNTNSNFFIKRGAKYNILYFTAPGPQMWSFAKLINVNTCRLPVSA